MTNPLSLFALIWRARRPSLTADMRAVSNGFWLRRGYDALTFFGTIVTATDEEARLMNGSDSPLKRHEMIHLRQAQACGDSWMRFYLLYIWYYLRALPQNRRMANAAYWLNPFEIEAYAHMNEPRYPAEEGAPATEWKTWAAMKPAERLKRLSRNSA